MAEEKQAIWTKEMDCPLCKKKFMTENIWTNRVKFTDVYTDMCKKYEDLNPLLYEIWVCPHCLYSSYRKEGFENISDLHKDKFKEQEGMRKRVAGTLDFSKPRCFETGVNSYKLAMLCMQCRKTVSAARFALLFMRLGWLFRWKGMPEEEIKYLKMALNRYIEAYEKEMAPEIGNMGETGHVYMIGELLRRTGEKKKAMDYFMKIITNKEMVGDPQYIRMARDQLSFIKEGKEVDILK